MRVRERERDREVHGDSCSNDADDALGYHITYLFLCSSYVKACRIYHCPGQHKFNRTQTSAQCVVCGLETVTAFGRETKAGTPASVGTLDLEACPLIN